MRRRSVPTRAKDSRMELDFALLARSAVAHENELYIHGGAIADISVPSIPTSMPISIAARFIAQTSEIGTSPELGLHVYEPMTSEPSGVGEPIPIQLEPSFLDDLDSDTDEILIMVVLNVGRLRIPRPGTYRFELALNGEVVKTLRLKIDTAEPSRGPHYRLSRPFVQETREPEAGGNEADDS
jgi:Family of unknown function (DUF6941)